MKEIVVKEIRKRTNENAEIRYLMTAEQKSVEAEEKTLYHLSVFYQEGEYKTLARIVDYSDSKEKAAACLERLANGMVTPLSLTEVYEDGEI